MDSSTPRTQRLHPLVAAAAVSVIAVSALGAVALVNGQVFARHSDVTPATVASAAPLAPATPEPVPATVPTPAAQPPAVKLDKPVAKAPAAKPRAPAADAPAPVAQAPVVTPPVITAPPPVEAVPAPRSVTPPVIAQVCHDCGTVIGVREVKEPGHGSGIGAVAGGVLGAVLGNQVGEGQGKKAARVLGAVGGAVAGHQIEKQTRSAVYYLVDVRMDDGTTTTVRRDTAPAIQGGARVRVQGGQLLTSDGSTVGARSVAPADPFGSSGA
jgi:outer membrane lipoprotein SlyB